ncbi:hypothetical protein ABB37_00478 [Leptomonas pyrrhocoris]|uniref:Uncharacterized protein n=1 Tax=Leptomonas pyrrhocoris TaxID=157538 RepID=A0A0N0VHZ6_LEPPY|nr:hypothetical protein ABB37_00478 [Leptomonas pyrrhocoris]KPA86244.1 hypothetical protein ABB37_00478 [Leptomonas pyrrhocoris]|eukprot:XP_015664683.1 hypothetical protein ABB37_00478 [Leptomonas pyrrhocoris]
MFSSFFLLSLLIASTVIQPVFSAEYRMFHNISEVKNTTEVVWLSRRGDNSPCKRPWTPIRCGIFHQFTFVGTCDAEGHCSCPVVCRDMWGMFPFPPGIPPRIEAYDVNRPDGLHPWANYRDKALSVAQSVYNCLAKDTTRLIRTLLSGAFSWDAAGVNSYNQWFEYNEAAIDNSTPVYWHTRVWNKQVLVHPGDFKSKLSVSSHWFNRGLSICVTKDNDEGDLLTSAKRTHDGYMIYCATTSWGAAKVINGNEGSAVIDVDACFDVDVGQQIAHCVLVEMERRERFDVCAGCEQGNFENCVAYSLGGHKVIPISIFPSGAETNAAISKYTEFRDSLFEEINVMQGPFFWARSFAQELWNNQSKERQSVCPTTNFAFAHLLLIILDDCFVVSVTSFPGPRTPSGSLARPCGGCRDLVFFSQLGAKMAARRWRGFT